MTDFLFATVKWTRQGGEVSQARLLSLVEDEIARPWVNFLAGSVRQATDRRTCKLSPGGNRSPVGDAHQRTTPGNSLLGRPCDHHLPRKSVLYQWEAPHS